MLMPFAILVAELVKAHGIATLQTTLSSRTLKGSSCGPSLPWIWSLSSCRRPQVGGAGSYWRLCQWRRLKSPTLQGVFSIAILLITASL